MNYIKLKPCPFCGSTARVWGTVDRVFGINRREYYTIECDNEECGCVYGDNLQLSYEEVIEAWNKRVGCQGMWVKEEEVLL